MFINQGVCKTKKRYVPFSHLLCIKQSKYKQTHDQAKHGIKWIIIVSAWFFFFLIKMTAEGEGGPSRLGLHCVGMQYLALYSVLQSQPKSPTPNTLEGKLQ